MLNEESGRHRGMEVNVECTMCCAEPSIWSIVGISSYICRLTFWGKLLEIL